MRTSPSTSGARLPCIARFLLPTRVLEAGREVTLLCPATVMSERHAPVSVCQPSFGSHSRHSLSCRMSGVFTGCVLRLRCFHGCTTHQCQRERCIASDFVVLTRFVLRSSRIQSAHVPRRTRRSHTWKACSAFTLPTTCLRLRRSRVSATFSPRIASRHA